MTVKTTADKAKPILSVRDLTKHYPLKSGVVRHTVGYVKAVDGVSFNLYPGETLGVVGESGCGKSTLGRLLVNLEPPTSGTITFEGRDVTNLTGSAMRKLRRDIQIVFQDPYTSLDPRMTVGDIVGEAFRIHPDAVPRRKRTERVKELLDLVGLNPEHINRYPHEFSGGQRQRIGIARGIALNPKVLVCDEPVSALDVSVQAQVVNLLQKLQRELGMAYIFIAHDLSVVRHISDRVAVMYLGRIMEIGDEEQIYERSTHPYTQALLSAVPVSDPSARGMRHQILRCALPGKSALRVSLSHQVLAGATVVLGKGDHPDDARRRSRRTCLPVSLCRDLREGLGRHQPRLSQGELTSVPTPH